MGIPGRSRVPRPARTVCSPARRGRGAARASARAARIGASVLGVLLLGSPGLTPSVAATGDDPVLGPWVDALAVGPAGEPSGATTADTGPRLLVVAPPDPHEPGTIHLVLLDRGPDTWSVAARLDVETGLAVAGPGELAALDDAVALVSRDDQARRTSVSRVLVGPTGIRTTAQVLLDVGAGGVGAADIDGDGVRELALTGAAARGDRGDGCRRTVLEVLDGRTLEPRSGPTPLGVSLSSAAIGRFGGRGESLVAVGTPGCDADTVPWVTGIISVDLATARTRLVRDLSAARPEASGVGPVQPLPVDLGGDGGDDVVVRVADGSAILEPDRDWRATTLDDGAIPLAVAAASTGPPVLVLYRAGVASDGRSAPTVELRVVRRDGPAIALGVRAVAVAVGRGPDGQAPPAAITRATDPAAPPPVWSGDLAGIGCAAIVVPAVTFQGCGRASAWTARTGPAWISTVPLASYGPPRARRLLVAAGLGWGTATGALASPSPAASSLARATGWRSAPSSPFALEELDAGDVAYFTSFPAAAIDVDPNGGGRDTPQLVLGGTAGDRVFARLTPAIPSAADWSAPRPQYVDDPTGLATAGFLGATPRAGASRTGVIPIPPASTAGANPGSIVLPLPLAAAAGTAPGDPGGAVAPLAAAWQVSALGLNAYGMPSPIVSALVAVDTTGPNLTLDPPFVSLPWPLGAALRGVAEPGSRVGLDGGPLAEAAMNGAFEIRAQLAPWPQALTIRAVDEHGNVTIRTLDVVGGLDYRRLPWQSILVAATLLGAAVSTWRGPAALRLTRGLPASTARSIGSHGSGPIRAPADRATPIGGRGRASSSIPSTLGEPVAEIEDLP
jgi:hypothetical protein